MSPEFSLCSQSTVYVPRILFMSLEDSLCPQSRVYVPIVQSMFQEYSLSSIVLFISL